MILGLRQVLFRSLSSVSTHPPFIGQSIELWEEPTPTPVCRRIHCQPQTVRRRGEVRATPSPEVFPLVATRLTSDKAGYSLANIRATPEIRACPNQSFSFIASRLIWRAAAILSATIGPAL